MKLNDTKRLLAQVFRPVFTKNRIPILLVLLCFQLFSTLGYSQAKQISLEINNKSIKDILFEIEQKSDYYFTYNINEINANRKTSLIVNNKSIPEILNTLFVDTDIKYDIKDKHIALFKSNKAPTVKSEDTGKNTIIGNVKDNKGSIVGASVVVKGTAIGTTTDAQGNFSLKAPKDAILEVSFIGYVSKEVKVGTGTNYNILIEEDANVLDEVVVVGYGSQVKKTLTGAVSVMKMQEIESSTVSTVSHALAGRAAGLQVNQQSAQPGGGAKFRIRGEGSVGAGNEPLFVIDGFPISPGGTLGAGNIYEAGQTDNVLESLNPDDIETITVLKDAASTAIYGSRAGHGVILITTKRGKNKRPTITYSGSASVQRIRAQYEMLDVKSYMVERNEQSFENYLKEYGLGIYEGYIARKDDVPKFKPVYTNDEILHASGTDWLDLVTRTGSMHQHNLSILGGTESTKYMMSVNYMEQDGVVRNNGASRLSARLNLDQEIGKYFAVGVNATYSINQYDNVPLGESENEYSGVLTSAIQFDPSAPVYNEDGTYYIDPDRSYVPNPLSLLDIKDKTKKDRVLGSIYALVKPINGLEIKFQLGADRKFQKRKNYLPNTTLEGQKHKGFANIREENGTDYLMDLTATYSKSFNDHRLKVMAGYSFQRFTGDGMSAGNKDFIIDGFGYNNIGAGASPSPEVGSWAWLSSLGSYFSRLNYSYMDKYLFEATIRADGESNFAPENRWGYFPSVSLGWVISQESFMESTKSWLSQLKIRGSFGQAGNSNVGYRINSFYEVGRNYIFGDTSHKGVYISELGNPEITWETTSEFNLGLDLGLFNNRILLTAEYFDRQIDDLLVREKPIPSYNEVTKIASNAGATKSKGFELTINTKNVLTNSFTWNTALTLAHYQDRWHKRDPNWKPEPYEKENDRLRSWWTYESLGIMQVGEAAPKAQANLLPGMIKLKDQNDDGIINNMDMVYQGNGAPNFTFGFTNMFTYKNLDLSIYFYGESGRKVGASYKENWNRMFKGQNIAAFGLNAFDSKNTSSSHPTYIVGGDGWGDYYVKSMYYIRCGNITLGYKIPLKNNLIKNVRVFADVTNPFIITNWTGLDPETDSGSFSYPNITSYSLGLNISF